MSKRVDLHVGTIDDMGRRFVSAWHRQCLAARCRVPFVRDG